MNGDQARGRHSEQVTLNVKPKGGRRVFLGSGTGAKALCSAQGSNCWACQETKAHIAEWCT